MSVVGLERELNWGQDSILIITWLTSSTAAYRIEILSPTDSGYSTRFGALNSTSSKARDCVSLIVSFQKREDSKYAR